MTDNVFADIITQLTEYKIDKICPYLENEPLADPQIFERIRHIRKSLPNSLIEVSTNALALSEPNQLRLIEELADGEHEIWISFHGIDKYTYEGVMGLPFEKCLNNIAGLLKKAEELPLRIKIRGAGYGRHASLKHPYSFSANEFTQFWRDVFQQQNITKTHDVAFFTYHDRAGSISRNNIRMPEIVRPDLQNFQCSRIPGWLHFLYTGELILCCMDYQRETVYGDIRESKLNDILSSENFRNLYAKVTGRQESPNDFICKRCISPGG
ncbi:SPASM domain-containing protein [Desulfovibrio sp. OttesenSCG-928-C06]|nr:SPASM domain-containing protein [Desulfovibrio sp. OttesenSCG-928-C06]